MSRAVQQLKATRGSEIVLLSFYNGQNSFGEPDRYLGKRPKIKELRGWPLHAVRTWLVGHGYEYEIVR